MMNPCVASLNKSATLKITSLTKKLIIEGKDVVNFAAGEPDFDTPPFIKDAAKKAIAEGFTKYTSSVGFPQLREAIANKLRKDNKIDVSASNVIVTSGAKYALFAAMFALLDLGDEVILPCPYWVSYPEMLKMTSAKTILLPGDETNNFRIDLQRLKDAINPKTKILILNYPNNPTGMTYSLEKLNEIYDIVKDKNIFVISDEIYEELTYDGKKHTSFASLGQAKEFTITINGFSKTFSMTGWRIGYLAAPDSLVENISKIIDHTTSCASAISQKAALAALGDKDWKTQARDTFEKRRNILWEGLSKIDRLKPLKSEGTFYMFCNIGETNLTSFDFSTQLLQRHLVSVIPSEPFGKEGFIRLSFSTSLEQIKKGIERIKQFISEI